jgi:hypothetical protein
MSKQKMNNSSSVHQHQLSRKNNDSHSRKLHINYQDFVPITKKTSNPANPPPKRKRSLSALKLDRSSHPIFSSSTSQIDHIMHTDKLSVALKNSASYFQS